VRPAAFFVEPFTCRNRDTEAPDMAQQRKTAATGTGSRKALRRILATLPDAVGAQSVIVVGGTKTRPLLALLLLKIGEGIKDASIIQCQDRNDAAAVIQEHQPLAPQELSIDTGRTLLAAALAEGASADEWPDAARLTGLDNLTPCPIAGPDWLNVLDPERDLLTVSTQAQADAARTALSEAADWGERHPLVGTWEEDLGCLIDAGADPNAHRRDLYEYVYPAVERNRGLWQEILLRAAVVLRHNHPDWFGMALSAVALGETEDMRKVPVAQVIAGYTARTFHDNPHGYPQDDGDEHAPIETGPAAEPGELERLLARADVEADVEWLDGYMTACELAPEPTSYETWANDLIAGGDLRSDLDATKRLVDLAFQRFETMLDALEDPDAIRASVDGVSADNLAAWARGFVAATERIPGSWPADSLRAVDRAWLDALTALAHHGTPIADRQALADWLVERAELTSQPDS
jgi:hypothetical protein